MKKPFTREQKMTIVYGILCLVLVLVILQLWLLVAVAVRSKAIVT